MTSTILSTIYEATVTFSYNSTPFSESNQTYDYNTTTVEIQKEKEDEDDDSLPVYGYPGANFYIIHIVGLVSLVVSLIVSTAVLYYLLRKGKML